MPPLSPRRFFNLLLLVLFPVLDVATILAIAHFFGIVIALGIVAVSTTLGLLACRVRLRKLAADAEAWRKRYGEKVPDDYMVFQGSQLFVTFLAIFFFLFPGLLSDLFAFLLTIPALRKGAGDRLFVALREKARQEGKTMSELLGQNRCGPNQP